MSAVRKKAFQINFNELNEEAQTNLYRNHKDKFEATASKSKYYTVRLMVAKDEETSEYVLNEMIMEETDFIVFKQIFKSKKLKKTDELIKELFTSKGFEIRKIIAYEETSSELLNWMLKSEIENHVKVRNALNSVAADIVNNSNFVETAETKDFLFQNGCYIDGVKDNKLVKELN